jgi:hypothetical protein
MTTDPKPMNAAEREELANWFEDEILGHVDLVGTGGEPDSKYIEEYDRRAEQISALLRSQPQQAPVVMEVPITHEQLCHLACDWSYSLEEAWDTASMAFEVVGLKLVAAPHPTPSE